MAGDIVYQKGNFTVRKAPKGYEVYEEGNVAATRRAFIGEGPGPSLGHARAVAEADKRHAASDSGGKGDWHPYGNPNASGAPGRKSALRAAAIKGDH